MRRRAQALLIAMAIGAATGCRAEPAAERPRRDLAGLAKVARLPATPLEVRWTVSARGHQGGFAPGPTDYLATAVLTFNDEDTRAILEKASSHPPPSGAVRIEPRPWFPTETAGALDGGRRVDPTEFLHPPFSTGVLIFLEAQRTFVLQLYTL